MGEFGTGAGAHEQPPGRRGGLAGRRGLLVTLVAVPVVLVLFAAFLVANGAGAPSQAPPAGASTDTSGSPPPGSFAGKLITSVTGGYQVLAAGPDGKLAVTQTVTTSDESPSSVSPDRRTIAYPRDGGLYVRTLPDGPERKLASDWPDREHCLKWAPDGQKLLYRRAADLAVIDLEGHVTVVDRVKQETYYVKSTNEKVTVSSVLLCTAWLDDHRLLFDRTKKMPAEVTVDMLRPTHTVGVDTTTMATLGGPTPRLTDTGLSPTTPKFLHTCGSRMVSQTTDNALYVLDAASEADIVRGTPLTAPAARIGTGTYDVYDTTFAPGTCQPWVQIDGTLRAIDPATHTIDDRTTVKVPKDFGSGADGLVTWRPQPGSPALVGTASDGGIDRKMMLVDVAARTAVLLPVAKSVKSLSSVLAWLP